MNRIAIIGFGGAGYSAALAARRQNPEATIDVYSDTNTAPYNPMLTTYYVKGSIPYDALFPFGSVEKISEELHLSFHAGTPVTGINPAEKALLFADGSSKTYDNILISTGASAVMPPLPGTDLPGVFKMRTVDDAVQLKEALATGKVRSGLVFGASWSGIKVVEDFVEAGVDCTLMNRSRQAFSKALFPQTAERVQEDLRKKGVHLAFGQTLDHIEPSEDGRLTAVTASGERYTVDMISITSGVKPNLDFLKGTDVTLGKGVLVNDHMQSNYPGIYAAGDCCDAYETQSRTQRNIALWLNSMQQGRVAGCNMAGGDERFGANLALSLGHYLKYDFFTIGDVSLCRDTDEHYEYEDGSLYIRGVRDENEIKCLNVIGAAESNGILKGVFIKKIENMDAELDLPTICSLKESGFPDSFIDFLKGQEAG